MKNVIPYILLICSYFAIACNSNNSNSNPNTERQLTFYKIVDHFKHGYDDSAKALILNHVPDDTVYFNYNLSQVYEVIKGSDSVLPLVDSIVLIDSLLIGGTRRLDYRLNFYKAGQYIGKIEMSFLNDVKNKAVNVFGYYEAYGPGEPLKMAD